MDDFDYDTHYKAFQWALSKNWKDKNKLYRRIQGKILTLVEEYGLKQQDIVGQLFENYWNKGHYSKFDETRGSLNNWIAGYVYFYLNHMIRKYAVRAKQTGNPKLDPLDQRNWADIEWIDRENEKDDPNFQPEILIDTNNPESLLIAKETFEFASNHFTNPQMSYMFGEMDLEEAAALCGIAPDTFRKRLDRRRADFCQAYDTIETAG